jgi:hypothetical protein
MPAVSKSVTSNQRARVRRQCCGGAACASPSLSARHVDLPLASPADEPNDGPCERLAKRSPVGTARQGSILMGAERRLNIRLPTCYISTNHHCR